MPVYLIYIPGKKQITYQIIPSFLDYIVCEEVIISNAVKLAKIFLSHQFNGTSPFKCFIKSNIKRHDETTYGNLVVCSFFSI